MLAEWPLIGRRRELAHLRSLLADPRSRGAMLAGPAGVGKTRLARECLSEATQAGMATLTVTGSQSAAAVPYGAVASVLSAFGGVGTKASDYPDPGEFVNDVMLGIIAGSRPRRVFLLVDDAHLLDSASALLILRLAQREEVFVLLTVRAREPVPDAITSLWKDGLLERLEIANLDGAAIEELLSTVLGGPVDGATLAALTTRSDANLLFLRELVAAALADGTLRQEHGLWRLVGESPPPDRLIEVVESRLARLSSGAHHLLELIAIGEPVGARELQTLSRLEVAEQLEDLGLVTSRDDGRRLELRLAHPIYGEVLRSRLSDQREQHLARSLAEATEQTGMRRRGDILRVGTWHLRVN